MHTKESITADLENEFKNLSEVDWSLAGDVNPEEHGGVKYRKEPGGSETRWIDIIYYPGDCEPEVYTSVDLNDLIAGIDDIWTFSDLENCGLDIGWAIQSLHQWNGILS